MPALEFPTSPNLNQLFSSNGKTWEWNGTFWALVASVNTIGTASITAAKIATGAVTETKIGAGAVTQAKLTSGLSGITVTTTALRDTVIPSPFAGQFAFLTDTNAFIRWNGSAWVTAIVTTPTEAPTSLALVSATTTTATISFAAGADGGSAITNYQYAFYSPGSQQWDFFNALLPADGTSPITITGLTPGTEYQVKLKAVNAQGVSNVESQPLSFSTIPVLTVDYLVVAGGGGGGGGNGGNDGGGGGGAGGYRTNVVGETSGRGALSESALSLNTGTTYSITIGSGGAGGNATADGTTGSNSVFSTITSNGGGGGGGNNRSGLAGGSGGGGGGGGAAGAGGAGTLTQGFDGRTVADYRSTGSLVGGGGGGAGSAPATPNGTNSSPPHGGNGVLSSINGVATTRGGGGGGGGGAGGTPGEVVAGTGGSGGGGAGGQNASVAVNASSGTLNTGGGGGGGRNLGGSQVGGSGGSGVAILRYPSAYTITIGAGLTGSTSTVGSNKVTTITAGTGNVSWA